MTSASRSGSKEKSRVLTINAEFVGHDGESKLPRSYAYVFTPDGKLLNRTLLDGKNSAKVELPAGASDQDQDVLVYIGPESRAVLREEEEGSGQEPPRRTATLTLEDVVRRGAEGQTFTFKGGARELTAQIALFPDRWIKWPVLGFCVVRGKVQKSLPGPDRPIPNATVEIYEVDPIHILIPKLPPQVIDHLRDILKPPRIDPERFRPRIPIPRIPPIPPPPDPPFRHEMLSLNTDLRGIVDAQAADIAPVNSDIQVMAAIERNPALSDLRFAAQTAGDLQFQKALILNPALTKMLLCLIYPPLVTMTLVATAKTNRCGEFKAVFYKSFFNPDQPDLYFKVKQKVFPFFPPITIYAPTPIPCFTYWDYPCGMEVTLVSSHPWAVAGGFCDLTLAEKGVLVNRIGGTYVGSIHGATGALASGITPARRGLLNSTSDIPWGSSLWFQLAFDYDHMVANGIKYYRLSWARGTLDSTIPAPSAFTAINTPIRWYKRFAVSQDPVEVLIGPQPSTDNLYEIQPQSLPMPFWWDSGRGETLYHAILPTDVPGVAQGTGWTSALLPDGADNAGKFLIKIELFDAAKNKIDLVAKQVGFWIANSANVNAQDPADAAAINDNSYFLTLHIDNNRCLALVQTPWLQRPNGTSFTADPNCGMLDYPKNNAGDKLGQTHVPYVYGHRNGFATWSFAVTRGAGIPVGSASTPLLISNSPQGAQSGDFSESVADMLGNCNAAAFVAKSDVDALATNGFSRLYTYDAYDDFAFGLTPEA